MAFKKLDLPIEDMEQIFLLLDADRTGSLGLDEFVRGIFRMQETAKQRDIIEIQAKLKSLAKRFKKMSGGQHDRKTLEAVFNGCCLDENGCLSRTEFQNRTKSEDFNRIFADDGMNLEAESMFGILDMDGVGSISLSEFIDCSLKM